MEKFKDQGERIKKMREQNTDLKANAMAKKMGIGEVRYGHYERGRSEMPTDVLKKFCNLVNVSPNYIRFGTPLLDDKKISINNINIIGSIQAGTWRENRQWEPEDWESAMFNLNNNERSAYGLKVLGDSMDEYYKEGTILVVLPLNACNGIESGDHVIVERCRGGDIYETTVKEIVIYEDKAELWPRSKNPKFKEPVNLFWPYDKLQQHGIETVEIKAVVIGSINRRKRIL